MSTVLEGARNTLFYIERILSAILEVELPSKVGLKLIENSLYTYSSSEKYLNPVWIPVEITQYGECLSRLKDYYKSLIPTYNLRSLKEITLSPFQKTICMLTKYGAIFLEDNTVYSLMLAADSEYHLYRIKPGDKQPLRLLANECTYANWYSLTASISVIEVEKLEMSLSKKLYMTIADLRKRLYADNDCGCPNV